MDLYQFEQVYDELGRQEKKQFADYINNQVLNLQEINYQYEKKNPLTKEELLKALSSQEDVLELIIEQDIDEAKDWLERMLM
jgi:predicted RNA-binding protein with EMAP domain